VARKLSSREKMALAAAGLAVVLFVLIKWVAVPSFRFLSGASETTESLLTELIAYQEVVARGPGLKRQNQALDAALEKHRIFFLPGEKPPLAAAALERRLKELAARVGLNIVSQKIIKPREEEFSVEIPVQIVATGSISNFRDFILLLQGEKMYIGVNEMAFRSLSRRQTRRGSQGAGRETDLQATLTVAGFIPPADGT
jgi:hypothetical protein